jgi:hypothetical protein
LTSFAVSDISTRAIHKSVCSQSAKLAFLSVRDVERSSVSCLNPAA